MRVEDLPANLLRQWIRTNLELHQLAGVPFSTFSVEWRSSRVGGPDGFTLPTAIGVVNAAIHAFCIKAHRIRNAERQELAINESQQTFRLITRRQRNVFSEAEQIES